MRVKEVAKKLGVNETNAYRILKFMVDAGLSTKESSPKKKGKGRPAALFNITREGVDGLYALLGKLVPDGLSTTPIQPAKPVEVRVENC